MARYSPRDPGYTRSPSLLEGLSHIVESGARGYTTGEADSDRRESARLDQELQELELYQGGVRRGRAPTEEVPEEEDIFGGELPGQQRTNERSEAAPPIFQGALPGRSRPSTGLEAGLGDIAAAGVPPEPEIVAVPGSYVEGMGFTDRIITDQDLVAHTRAANRVPRRRVQPGYQQATDDLYIDEAATPEGREAARETAQQREQRRQLEASLGMLQEGGREALSASDQATLMEGDVPSSVIFGSQATSSSRRDPAEIQAALERLRQNPDDPQAQARAFAAGVPASQVWPRPASDEADITNEVTRRQFATRALTAIQDAREEWADMTQYQRDQRIASNQGLGAVINRIVRDFSYDSVEEFQQELRDLRLTGVGAGGEPAPAPGGGDISDELIQQLVRDNPNLSAEEIYQMLEEQR